MSDQTNWISHGICVISQNTGLNLTLSFPLLAKVTIAIESPVDNGGDKKAVNSQFRPVMAECCQGFDGKDFFE